MTQRQRAFVRAYLECANASEAARRAGYSQRTAYSQGYRLLRNVEIVGEIEQQTADAAKHVRVTVEWVLEGLARTYQEAFERGHYSAAVACLGLLGKHLGMFERRTPVPQLTQEERLQRLKVLFGISDSPS